MSATSPSSLAIQAQRSEPGGETPAAAALSPSRKRGQSGPDRGSSSAFSEILAGLRSVTAPQEARPAARNPLAAAAGQGALGPVSGKASAPQPGGASPDGTASAAGARGARPAARAAASAAAAQAAAAPPKTGAEPAADMSSGAGARTAAGQAGKTALREMKQQGYSEGPSHDEPAGGRRKPRPAAPDAKSDSTLVPATAVKAAPGRQAAGSAPAGGSSAAGEAVGAAEADAARGPAARGKGGEPNLSVLDLRRSAEGRRGEAARSAAAQGAADAPAEAKGDGAAPRGELVRTLDAGAELSALADRTVGTASAAEAPTRGEGASDFRSILAERLQDSWNAEIVKSAHIVLRDGDSGTIRLRLKPESLGSVKIELNLSDNNISGRIVVESDEAKSAFERNMSELADAFKQGGFESARLEVSVGSGSGGGAPGGDAGGGPFYSERLRSASASSAEPATAVAAYARAGGSVDIFA